MSIIRVQKCIDSETLHLPELKALIGKMVEIVILEAAPGPATALGARDSFTALAPQRAAPSADEWEKLRQAAGQNAAMAAVLDIAVHGGIDADAIAALRAASLI
jgi:hypothetical protein